MIYQYEIRFCKQLLISYIFYRFALEEIADLVKSLKKGKSPGLDSIYEEHFRSIFIYFFCLMVHPKQIYVTNKDSCRWIRITCVMNTFFFSMQYRKKCPSIFYTKRYIYLFYLKRVIKMLSKVLLYKQSILYALYNNMITHLIKLRT